MDIKKTLSLIFMLCTSLFGAENPVAGFWVIPDSDTGKPESVAYFYEQDGVFAARMILIYDETTGKIDETYFAPKERANGIPTHPYICGMDFIWGLKPESAGKYLGKVIDPNSGNVYKCEVWYDKSAQKLAVRGEWFIFGLTNLWPPIAADKLPKNLVAGVAKFKQTSPIAAQSQAQQQTQSEAAPDSQQQQRQRPRFYRIRHY